MNKISSTMIFFIIASLLTQIALGSSCDGTAVTTTSSQISYCLNSNGQLVEVNTRTGEEHVFNDQQNGDWISTTDTTKTLSDANYNKLFTALSSISEEQSPNIETNTVADTNSITSPIDSVNTHELIPVGTIKDLEEGDPATYKEYIIEGTDDRVFLNLDNNQMYMLDEETVTLVLLDDYTFSDYEAGNLITLPDNSPVFTAAQTAQANPKAPENAIFNDGKTATLIHTASDGKTISYEGKKVGDTIIYCKGTTCFDKDYNPVDPATGKAIQKEATPTQAAGTQTTPKNGQILTITDDKGVTRQWVTIGDKKYSISGDKLIDDKGNTVGEIVPLEGGGKGYKMKDGTLLCKEKCGDKKEGDKLQLSQEESGYELGIKYLSFLTEFSSALNMGYHWRTLFYDADAERNLLGSLDNDFNSKILGGTDFWISEICRMEEAPFNADSTPQIIGGSSGGDASGWIAAERMRYDDYSEGSKRAGYIYKIAAELTYGTCRKMNVQMLIGGRSLFLDQGSGQGFTFSMGTDTQSGPISYTGDNMIRFFSEKPYSQVCFYFTQLSTGCLLDIEAPDQVCRAIVIDDRASAPSPSSQENNPTPAEESSGGKVAGVAELNSKL